MSAIGSLSSKYEWKIPNFRSYAGYRSRELLLSPCFRTYHCEKDSTNAMCLQWRLRIYPGGFDEARSKYMSVYLENLSEFEVTAKYSFTIIDVENTKNNFSKISVVKIFQPKGTPTDSNKQIHDSWGWLRFVEKDLIFSEQSKFFENNALTISCTIFETSVSPNVQVTTNLEALSRFENLLESEKFGDVTFNVGEKKLKVHKAFLSTASEVFQAMFDHEMTEQKENVVNIVDIDFDIMKEMFRFIYARKVNNIDKIASDLLVAADKYCIIDLKELCEKTLCKNLNVDNALQYLELAVEYNATKLKSKTVEFAAKKLKNIVKSEEFKSLSSESRGELLLYIASNQ